MPTQSVLHRIVNESRYNVITATLDDTGRDTLTKTEQLLKKNHNFPKTQNPVQYDVKEFGEL